MLPETHPSSVSPKERTVPIKTPLGCYPACNSSPVGFSLAPRHHQFWLPDSQEPPSASSLSHEKKLSTLRRNPSAEKQDTACSWERFGEPFPTSCTVMEFTTAPPALPASLAPPVPQGDATETFLPLFPPLKQGKEGGNSKAKGKNKTTKHRIICIFHHLAEGIF